MMKTHSRNPLMRSAALLVAGAMITPTLLAGCGGQPQSSPPPPPIDASQGGARPPAGRAPVAQKPGMSTKQKVLLLAGAAALWYMYNKHRQKAQAQGQTIQYYRSKNGRIYYRDPQTHQAIYVTPPQQPMRVTVSPQEAQQYQDIEGYNNQRTGRGLDDLFSPAQP